MTESQMGNFTDLSSFESVQSSLNRKLRVHLGRFFEDFRLQTDDFRLVTRERKCSVHSPPLRVT